MRVLDYDSCEYYSTGYTWHEAEADRCLDADGALVAPEDGGTAKRCESRPTGNTWNLDTARVSELVFQVAPGHDDWDGDLLVRSLMHPATGLDLLAAGRWHNSGLHMAQLRAPDELEGVICERCLPGQEPAALKAATACRSCAARGPGFFSAQGESLSCVRLSSFSERLSLSLFSPCAHMDTYLDTQSAGDTVVEGFIPVGAR